MFKEHNHLNFRQAYFLIMCQRQEKCHRYDDSHFRVTEIQTDFKIKDFQKLVQELQ